MANVSKIDYSALKLSYSPDENAIGQKPLAEPARVLPYGKAKTRKTWWAGTAGETHNVTILDGENGTGILSQLPPAFLENINRVPLATDPDSVSFALFLTLLFQKKQFLFSIEKQRDISYSYIKAGEGEEDEHKLFLACDLELLTTDDVLVIDSWTAIVRGVTRQYMKEKNLDPFDGKLMPDGGNKYEYFGYSNIVLDNILEGLNRLPCHVILIAHEDRYNHEYKEGMIVKKETKLQVLSSSGNQAAKIPGVMGDILWFKHANDQNKSVISSKPSNNRDGGARRLEPNDYTFPDWGWKQYCSEAKIPPATKLRGADERPPIALLTGAMIKNLMEGDTSSNVVNG